MTFLTRRTGLALMMMVLLLGMSLPAMAQDGGGRGGRGGPGGGQRGGFQDMTEEEREAFREQMEERMAQYQAEMDERTRESLDMSEVEFDLINPMIQNIQKLVRERDTASRGGFGNARGGRGGEAGGRGGRGGQQRGQGGRGGFNPFGEPSELGTRLQDATTELREVLADEDSGAKDIIDALTELRASREAMASAIHEAREDLRALLTARQEAQLVVNSVLCL